MSSNKDICPKCENQVKEELQFVCKNCKNKNKFKKQDNNTNTELLSQMSKMMEKMNQIIESKDKMVKSNSDLEKRVSKVEKDGS